MTSDPYESDTPGVACHRPPVQIRSPLSGLITGVPVLAFTVNAILTLTRIYSKRLVYSKRLAGPIGLRERIATEKKLRLEIEELHHGRTWVLSLRARL